MTAAPYPADTRAKGWRFEIDVERIEQSDTWTLAPFAVRPWLLILWMTAWKQTPCGTLTNDDMLIAARIGMTTKDFAKHRAILMRGWWLADDGRLYHVALTERVEAMLVKREKDAGRTAARRARTAGVPASPPEVPGMSHVTPPGLTGEFDTKHQAPSTSNQTPEEKRERSPSGSRLSSDWVCPEEWLTHCSSERPELDARVVAVNFADYWHAKAGAGARKADWLATWRSWVRKESPPQHRGQSPPAETFRERDTRISSEKFAILTGRSNRPEQPLQEVFDVTPRKLG